jgi:hypothetical protein
MAKRRKEKDEEEEDKPFKPPKFDEKEFIKKEKRNIRATFIAFLFGCLMALVCFGFWALMGHEVGYRWLLVLLVVVANATFLKYIFTRFNIDFSDFTKKNWFTNIMVYFFAWLLIMIILVNPPFYDDEPPRVELVVLPEMQEPGGTIKFIAKITDNVGVNHDSIALDITNPDGAITSLTPVAFEFDDKIVKFEFENPEETLGDFEYTLTVCDLNELTTKKSGTFSYDLNVITVRAYRYENITIIDYIRIEVDKDISKENFRVYYTLNDDEEINVDRRNKEVKDEYETGPEYKGWEPNSNYTMRAYAETSHYFTGINKKYSNIVKDKDTYNFTTADDGRIGDEIPPKPWNWSKPSGEQAPVLLNYDHYNPEKEVDKQVLLPHPRSVQVPGFEIILLLVALAAVVLIFKYKKKDENK